jgi:SPX domain protein involved in polyphosphate accumulation
MRYERKFAVESLGFDEILRVIQLHPAHFSEVYPPRWVNNIYLDTEGLDSYLDNVNGVMARVKHRVRWYGEPFGPIDEPRWEIKLKRGFVGEKRSYRLKPFTLDSDLTAQDLLGRMAEATDGILLKEQLRNLRPKMFNRYRRLYYLSFDRRFRITVDHRMSYGRFPPRQRKFFGEMDEERTVVELKYDVEHDPEAQLITSAFPFRLTKNSKYVTGVYSAFCTGF